MVGQVGASPARSEKRADIAWAVAAGLIAGALVVVIALRLTRRPFSRDYLPLFMALQIVGIMLAFLSTQSG